MAETTGQAAGQPEGGTEGRSSNTHDNFELGTQLTGYWDLHCNHA